MQKKTDWLQVAARIAFALLETLFLSLLVYAIFEVDVEMIIASAAMSALWAAPTYFMWTKDFTDDTI